LGDLLSRERPPRLEEVIRFYSVAVALRPQSPGARLNLGVALREKGQLDEAIAEHREAIRLKKDFPEAHTNLGVALRDKGRVDEAIAEYRAALRLRPNYPEAHCNLGQVFLQQGRFADALTALKRGHELGSKNPRWPYPSAQWVRMAEQLVAIEGKLPKLL